MTIGIYCLYFECADEQFYIGESSNIEVRYKRHCAELLRGTHVNSSLQTGFLIYGIPTIHVIEELSNVDIPNIGIREMYWINQFDSFKQGMNRTIGGEGCSYGEVHPSSLYSNDMYKEIMLQLANTDLSIAAISTNLKVPRHIINNISVGYSAAFLANDYPEEYLRMRNKVGKRSKGPKPMSAKFVSPQGEVHNVVDLGLFSTKNQLDLSSLYKLIKGTRSVHKGWKLYDDRNKPI